MISLPIVGISQNTYPKILNDSSVVISKLQLKQANILFAQHKLLKLENEKLKSRIDSYIKLNETNSAIILNKEKQLAEYENSLNSCVNEINSLTLQLKSSNRKYKQYKTITICGVAVSVTLALLLVVK